MKQLRTSRGVRGADMTVRKDTLQCINVNGGAFITFTSLYRCDIELDISDLKKICLSRVQLDS